MSNIFKGRRWEDVSEEKARRIAKEQGQSEELWEMFLMEANQQMLKELKEQPVELANN